MTDNIIYESEARAATRPTRPNTRQADPRQSGLPTDGPRLHRRRRLVNNLDVNHLAPPGYTYEWKAESVYGQPLTEHVIEIRENHWRPVPASRHPEIAAAGETTIRRAGTVLYERPSYLTEEAQMEEIDNAMGPLKAKEELMYGTPAGSAPRDHPEVRRRSYINRQYAPGDPILDTQDGSYSEP